MLGTAQEGVCFIFATYLDMFATACAVGHSCAGGSCSSKVSTDQVKQLACDYGTCVVAVL